MLPPSYCLRMSCCTRSLLTRTSWKVGDNPCNLEVDLYSASNSSSDGAPDGDMCARASVKFREADHVVLWIAILEWSVNAQVRNGAVMTSWQQFHVWHVIALQLTS